MNVESRLKTALGFIKARETLTASLPDAVPGASVATPVPFPGRDGLTIVYLDRMRSDYKGETAVFGIRDEEANTSLRSLHDLLRRRLAFAMEEFHPTTLVSVLPDAWLAERVDKSLEIKP